MARPFKWKNAKEILDLAEVYFKETDLKKQSITGLALALKTNRETFNEYGKRDDEFGKAVKYIKARIEFAYEQRGLERGNAFDIFALKNLGWTDRQEITGENGGALIVKWQK